VSGQTERKDLPADSNLPAVRPVKYVVLLDLVRGFSRIEYNGSGPNPNFERYIPRVRVSAYDGKTLQTSVDRKLCEIGPTNPDISLVKGPLDLMPLDSNIWPLLFAHGVVPTVNKPARPDRMPDQHTSEDFDYRGKVGHAGSQCYILKSHPVASTPFLVDEFLIDPDKTSAIVRHVYFAGKNPWFRFDVAYEQSESSWLPKSWTFAHSQANKLVEVTRFTVERLETNPPVTDADFVLPIPPGSIVKVQNYPQPGLGFDPSKPANGLFRVDEDGKWSVLEETGFERKEARVSLPRRPQNRRWTLWAGVGFALIGIAIVTVRWWRWSCQNN
jgi:hypothetical protein